jgi:hypothetical protein
MTSVAEEPLVPQEIAEEYSSEELREFLAPDLRATRADPAFRESLRQKLWALVQQGSTGDRDDRLD